MRNFNCSVQKKATRQALRSNLEKTVVRVIALRVTKFNPRLR